MPSAVCMLIDDDEQNTAVQQPGACTAVNSQVLVQPAQGPCHFGHHTTSGRKGGKVSWHVNPVFSMWPGKVPGLVVLCSRCYQCGYRAHRKKRMPIMHKFECSQPDPACPSPDASQAQCLFGLTAMMINKPLDPDLFLLLWLCRRCRSLGLRVAGKSSATSLRVLLPLRTKRCCPRMIKVTFDSSSPCLPRHHMPRLWELMTV